MVLDADILQDDIDHLYIFVFFLGNAWGWLGNMRRSNMVSRSISRWKGNGLETMVH